MESGCVYVKAGAEFLFCPGRCWYKRR